MWARIVMLVLGIWLMIAPGLLDFAKEISDNGHIVGPLIISFSIISFSECTRNVIWLNFPLGAWLLFGPWILDYHNMVAFASDYIVGLLTLSLSLVKLPTKNSFAGGWPTVWRSRKIQTH